MFGTAIATGRYHRAILLPRDDSDAIHLVRLSAYILSITTLLTITVSIVIYSPLVSLPLLEQLGIWLLVVPVAIAGTALYETLTAFNLRIDAIAPIAKSATIRSFFQSSSQVVMGYAGAGSPGLMGGFLIGSAFGNSHLVRNYRRQRAQVAITSHRVLRLAKEYSSFPKYEMLANLAIMGTFGATSLAIASLFSAAVLGQYAIAYRILTLPANFVGVSVADIYMREAARRVDDHRAARRALQKTVAGVFTLSLLPFVVIAFFAPSIFAIAFGEQWRFSGVIAIAMLPQVWARVVISPIYSTFSVYNAQAKLLIFQALLLLIGLGSILLTAVFDLTVINMLRIQSALMVGVFIATYISALRVIKSSGAATDQ